MRPILALLCLLAAMPAAAQHAGHHAGPHAGHHAAPAGAAQPYAGFAARPIKALSPEETADLRAGRGMAQALPAELNGYPGPMHALELAGPLGLDAGQVAALRSAMAAMFAAAGPLGERVIAAEAELDALFAGHRATPDLVRAATRAVAEARGALRAAHLDAHIVAHDLLTPAQRQHYAVLRGYAPVRR